MIAATSWFLLTLVGLGLPLAVIVGGARARARWRAGEDRATLIALASMLGLLADHAAGLITGSLSFQAALAWAGGIAGIGALALLLRAGWNARPGRAAVLAVILITILAVAATAAPLTGWDARSIWFFHGKVIFFDGGLRPSPFWSNPAYDWSHKDYPKLLPMLAARFAAVAGAWSDAAAKSALAPLGAGAFLGLLAASASQGFLILAPAAVAVLGAWLWSGYMDSWVALYGAVAVLAMSAWLETGRRVYLAMSTAALGIALCLKNEGQLLAAAGLPALLCASAARRRLRWQDLSVLIAFIPFTLWIPVKAELAAPGDLDHAGIVLRALEVAGDSGEFLYRLSVLGQGALLHSHLFATTGAFLAAGICVGFRSSALICGLTGALYAGGLVMVYLGTPLDFTWHVENSLGRVLMTPTLLLLSGLSTMIPDILAACRKPAFSRVS